MPKITSQLRMILLITLMLSLGTGTLSADYIFNPSPRLILPPFQCATPQLWGYLRAGLNYLESPQPLLPPESVSPKYIHPDAKGFGAYGFSPPAYEDVRRAYPFFREYAWQDIMDSAKLYDLASQAFADWLLENLKGYIPEDATQEEIFDVLHRAWNLGLSGFKKGRGVVSSRISRAEEFKARS